MKRFAQLLLDITSITNDITKVNLLLRYFESVENPDIIWTIALLRGHRPKRVMTTSLMREWATEHVRLPLWLFDDSCIRVGDIAETIAILIPDSSNAIHETLDFWLRYILDLKDQSQIDKKILTLSAWDQLDKDQRFVFNKLASGGMRTTISQKIMTKAIAKYTGADYNTVGFQLMSQWDPLHTTFTELFSSENSSAASSKPNPFYISQVMETGSLDLGDISDWQLEKLDVGIRCQLIFRNKEIHIWSSDEELVTHRYPELHDLINHVPNDTIIDGKIIAHNGNTHLPSNTLKKRADSKNVSKRLLKEVPICFIAFDILEQNGQDIRLSPLIKRRSILESILLSITHNHLLISEKLISNSWKDVESIRQNSRKYSSGGIVLKRKASIYKNDHYSNEWWILKPDRLTVDAVLIYAEASSSQSPKSYSSYTFAVWNNDILIPVTKATYDNTNDDISRVSDFIKNNTIERFGPVRSVDPSLVFKISFEGIEISKRRKSGLVMHLPKVDNWKEDIPASQANTLADLQKLLMEYGQI